MLHRNSPTSRQIWAFWWFISPKRSHRFRLSFWAPFCAFGRSQTRRKNLSFWKKSKKSSVFASLKYFLKSAAIFSSVSENAWAASTIRYTRVVETDGFRVNFVITRNLSVLLYFSLFRFRLHLRDNVLTWIKFRWPSAAYISWTKHTFLDLLKKTSSRFSQLLFRSLFKRLLLTGTTQLFFSFATYCARWWQWTKICSRASFTRTTWVPKTVQLI